MHRQFGLGSFCCDSRSVLSAILAQHQSISDHVFARRCAANRNGVLHTGADVANPDVLVELAAHFLSEGLDFLTVEIILDFCVVGCVVLERNEQHVQAGLLHREVPAEHGIVVG